MRIGQFVAALGLFAGLLPLRLVSQSLQGTSENMSIELPEPKDDPRGRLQFEILKTKDPVTGKVPENIRLKEALFMRSQRRNDADQLLSSTEWANRGPFNVGGRTRALAVHANDENLILAGGVSGGMWRSSDQGLSWTKTTGSNELQSVTCVAQDVRPGNTDVWYYGTGEARGNSASGWGAWYSGDGIFKSTDNGLTWSLLSSTSTGIPETQENDFDFNHDLVVNPINGHVFVANFGGIYRSTDGGSSFTKVLNGDNCYYTDVAVSEAGKLYAVLDNQGVYFSSNGSEWSDITPTGFPLASFERKELTIAPSNDDVIFIVGEDSNGPFEHMLWRYDRSIDTWVDKTANLPQLGGLTGIFESQGSYNLLIKIKPDDENFVILGGRNLWRSTDGFSSTTNTSWIGGYTDENNSYRAYSEHHPDQHSFVFLSNNEALSGNDGGVQWTPDIRTTGSFEPVTWTSLNNGYLTSQVYALSQGPEDQLIAGFQDNGTWFSSSPDGTQDWVLQITGDGSYSGFHSSGTTRFMSWQYGNMYRYEFDDFNDDSRGDAVYMTPNGYSSTLFIPPIYLDPLDNDIIYMGGDTRLYINDQSTTGSSSLGWKSLDLGTDNGISEMGTTLSNLIYVGTYDGELFKVSDPAGVPRVENVSGTNFPVGYISGIGVNQYNPDELLVCFSNYSIPSVFYSQDGGESWTDVSGNLEENPDGSGSGPSARVVRILGNGEHYFLGTSTGLYETTSLDGNSTIWDQEDAGGIGDVVVEHMLVRNSDGLVVAGTHGNGVFSASFDIAPAPANDLGITKLNSPSSGSLGQEIVAIEIANLGTSAREGFAVSLEIDGTMFIEENVASTILPGEKYIHQFTSRYDFNAAKDYELVIMLDDDGNLNNNIFRTVLTGSGPIDTFPYLQTFDNELEIPGDWSVDSESEFKWTIISGQTPSPETGPLGDNTTGVGNYAYSEASFGNLGNTTILTSPKFKLASLANPELRFYYHMYGSGIGELNVNIIDNQYQKIEVFSLNGGQQQMGDDSFEMARVLLDDYKDEEIRVQFEAARGNYFTSDIAIDDVGIVEAPTNDLGIASIHTVAQKGSTNVSVVAIIRNMGSSDAINRTVGLKLNGELVASEVVEKVKQGATEEFVFDTDVDFAQVGVYTITVNLPEDDYNENNEKERTFEIATPSTGFFEGNYILRQDMPTSEGAASFYSNGWIFNEAQSSEVTIEYIDNQTRQFEANYLLFQYGPSALFQFGLINGETVFIDNQYTNLDCNFGLYLGTADVPGRYDLSDDVELSFSLKENILSDCSFNPLDVSFTLTKVIGSVPTGIELTGNRISEDVPIGTKIGELFTYDEDPLNGHSYTITGDIGLEIGGPLENQLLTTMELDYETKNAFEITVETIDSDGNTFEQDFQIYVKNANESPEGIALSSNSILENAQLGTVIGQLSTTDQDAFDSHTYQLNPEAQEYFTVVDDELRTVVELDYEENPNLDILITSLDADGESIQVPFEIEISDVNEAPLDITIDKTEIEENLASGTVISSVQVVDDAGDTHDFTISGTDSEAFLVQDGNLVSNAEFDFESKSSYQIEIMASDNEGLTLSKEFLISVNDVNERPQQITLTNTEIEENQPVGTVISEISVLDQDANDPSVIEILGSDAEAFAVSGNELQSASQFDFESKSSYQITIKATDQEGLSLSEDFSIIVVDVDDDPLSISERESLVTIFPNPSQGNFSIQLDDTIHDAEISITDLSGKKVLYSGKDSSNLTLTLETAGIYLLKVQSRELTIVKKVIISR